MSIVRHVLNSAQSRAVELVKSGKSIFLTGSPGTGKSFTLKEIIRYLKESQIQYAVTSSTGCSAVLINGQTIHSFMGIGVGSINKENTIKKLKITKKYNMLRDLQCLIIDEISMIDDYTFENISSIMSAVKNNQLPFGGIQVILVGDFCQLAPVTGDYCFKSEEWKRLNLSNVILTELIRQKDDVLFQTILQEIRFGKCSNASFEVFKKMREKVFRGIKATKLYSLTSHVQEINTREYEKLFEKQYNKKPVDGKVVQCFPTIAQSDIDWELLATPESEEHAIYRYNAISNDKQIKISEYSIDLFVGLQVMVTRNISIINGLINGTIGTITKLTNMYVCIRDTNMKEHTIYYHKDTNDNSKTFVKFMPIKLAYSLSIHKSQGATLDAIEVDGGIFIFAPGQLYTAISRARSLDCIRLVNIEKDSFICNKSVKKFYNDLTEDNEHLKPNV